SGSARATLTSSSLAGTADVSAFIAEGASATVKVQMVASLEDVSRTSPVISLDAKYVAYSEGLRILEGMEHATARFEGLRVEADSAQVDLGRELLRARGNITVTGKGQTVTGQKLLVSLRGLRLTLLGRDGLKVYQGRGLQEQPKPLPAETSNLSGDLEFTDL